MFDEWRPSVDGVVDDLKLEVDKLSKLKEEVSRLSKHWDRVIVDASASGPGMFASALASRSAFIPDNHTTLRSTTTRPFTLRLGN